MGIRAFVVSGGASIGVLLGRPDAAVELALDLPGQSHCRPRDARLVLANPSPDVTLDMHGSFDLPGAFLVTASLVTAVYAIIGAGGNPFTVTALFLLLATALMVAFRAVERRSKLLPLVPLGIFASSRNLNVSSVVIALSVFL